jgi:lysyl-tRNA synthetase class 2
VTAPELGREDWRPTASLPVLRQRAELLRTVRQFFDARGYWEVETPLLSRDTCIDAWLDPILVPDPDVPIRSLFLQTSPEFAMKRLLAGGAEAIYQITKSFRRGESGARHNREFTLVEWYRTGDDHHAQMSVVESLVRGVAAIELHGSPTVPPLPAGAFPRFTYDDACEQALGTKVLALATEELAALAVQHGVTTPYPPQDRDGWWNLLLAERVEPWLAQFPAVFLHDYPSSQAALARVREEVVPVAERFELYLAGVELCNGYHELTDAVELAERMRRQNALRTHRGERPYPVKSRLLAAMQAGLPTSSGVALGFDRLVMWRLGLTDIRDAIAFPDARA